MKLAQFRKDYHSSLQFKNDLRGLGTFEIFKNSEPYPVLIIQSKAPEALTHKIIEMNFNISSNHKLYFITSNHLKNDSYKETTIQLFLLGIHLLTDSQLKINFIEQKIFLNLRIALENNLKNFTNFKNDILSNYKLSKINKDCLYLMDTFSLLILKQYEIINKEFNHHLSKDEINEILNDCYQKLIQESNELTKIRRVS